MVETAAVQDTPENILAHVDGLRARTHARVRGAWLPLLVFGLVTLPLYVRPFDFPHGGGGSSINVRVPFFAGLPGARSQRQAWLFWLVAAPLGYLVCALWYHRRAQRRGLAPRWRSYVGVGLGLFGFVAAIHLGPVRTFLPNPQPHGHSLGVGWEAALSPLVAVALGLLVLAWIERSWLVAVVALPYGALVLLINSYGFGNMPAWITRTYPANRPYFVAPAHNLVVLGSLLLLGAAGTGASAWRARRSS